MVEAPPSDGAPDAPEPEPAPTEAPAAAPAEPSADVETLTLDAGTSGDVLLAAKAPALPPGTWVGNGTTNGFCNSFQADDKTNPGPGEQSWHFVLTQPTASSSVLTYSFVGGPSGTIENAFSEAQVMHFYVITAAGAQLESASANEMELVMNTLPGPLDLALRDRARAVIPGGMYGHQNVGHLGADLPQFLVDGEGCRVTDVDGNTYVDFMCGYGPIILGYRHPAVEAAAIAQAERADTQNGPAPVMVELAETFVDTIGHADWAMFSKNGTDATTMCVTTARATTGRRRVLVAEGAYHGAAPWCTPITNGTVPEDRAHLRHFTYNDLRSVQSAVREAGDDLAAIVVSPFKHDARKDQELVEPEFAQGLRDLCDETGAALILDDVRCAFRLAHGSSWDTVGVSPDLSAMSKSIANGHPLAAVVGNDRFRSGASSIYVTGSFWFAAAPMAASLATLEALRTSDAVATMTRAGQRLRDGLAAQADRAGVEINQTGPVQMPLVTFADDDSFEIAARWTAVAARHGAYFHPWHNWFLSAAHDDAAIDEALNATEAAFDAVAASR